MQVGMAPSVRTGGSRHTGQAAPPPRNIHHAALRVNFFRKLTRNVDFPGFSKSYIRLSANPHRMLRLNNRYSYVVSSPSVLSESFVLKTN